jgi:serine protease AprX
MNPFFNYIRSVSRTVSGAAMALVLVASAAAGQGSKRSIELQHPTGTTDVIIQFTPAMSSIINMLPSLFGSTPKKILSQINGAVFNLPPQAIVALENNPWVKFVSPDRKVTGKLEFAEPAINANTAFQLGFDGRGVGVAVIDSGISPTSDLAGRVVYSESLVAGDSTTADAYGHGTHVAGILGGNAANSTGPRATRTFRGIAPNVKILNFRVLDGSGSGTDSAVIQAIEDAIALKNQYNIRVINLSLGRPVMESYTQDPFCQAVEQAWQAGIVVVVAAGNDGRDNSQGTNGYGTIASPGIDPYVITVGAMKDMGTATRADDLIASYSSKGPTMLDHIAKPDLVAPGNHIVSAFAAGSYLATAFQQDIVPVSYYTTSFFASPAYLFSEWYQHGRSYGRRNSRVDDPKGPESDTRCG